MSTTKYIKVSPETHQTLTALGRKGESYDAILVRLIAHYARTLHIDLSGAVGNILDIEAEGEDDEHHQHLEREEELEELDRGPEG